MIEDIASKPTKGFYLSCEDLNPDKRFIVYPGEESFTLPGDITVISALQMMEALIKL